MRPGGKIIADILPNIKTLEEIDQGRIGVAECCVGRNNEDRPDAVSSEGFEMVSHVRLQSAIRRVSDKKCNFSMRAWAFQAGKLSICDWANNDLVRPGMAALVCAMPHIMDERIDAGRGNVRVLREIPGSIEQR